MAYRARIVTAAMIASSMAACVFSERFTYYKPIGPGAYFKSCGHPWDNYLGFPIADGLGMMVYVPIRNVPNASVEVIFRVAEGHTLRLLSPTFQILVFSSDDGVPQTVHEVRRMDNDIIPGTHPDAKHTVFQIGAELHGAPAPRRFGLLSGIQPDFVKWIGYWLEVPVGNHKQADFFVRFPRLLLNGQPVSIPNIKFEYGTRTHTYIFRTGC